MTAQLRIFPENATTVLLVVPYQYDERYLLNEHDTDGYVEVGPCHALTDGILNAADKWKPDLLILPFIRSDSVLPREDLIRYEAVWSRLDIPIWIVSSDSPGGDNVACCVAVEKRRGREGQKEARVCSAAARLASRLGDVLVLGKPGAGIDVA